jgi:hypothetical protein
VGRFARLAIVLLLAGATVGGVAWAVYGESSSPYADTGVFTPAHKSTRAAVADFFGVLPDAVQPIEFPHNTHVVQKIACTEYCHEGVTKGPVAGLPSVKACMICHDAIATDRPIIQQISKLQEQGRDLAWQRVCGYGPGAREVQPRTARARERRLRDVSRQRRRTDGGAPRRRLEHEGSV